MDLDVQYNQLVHYIISIGMRTKGFQMLLNKEADRTFSTLETNLRGESETVLSVHEYRSR